MEDPHADRYPWTRYWGELLGVGLLGLGMAGGEAQKHFPSVLPDEFAFASYGLAGLGLFIALTAPPYRGLRDWIRSARRDGGRPLALDPQFYLARFVIPPAALAAALGLLGRLAPPGSLPGPVALLTDLAFFIGAGVLVCIAAIYVFNGLANRIEALFAAWPRRRPPEI